MTEGVDMRKISVLAAILAMVAGAAMMRSVPVAAQSDDSFRFLPDGIGVVAIDVQKVTSSDLWTTLTQKANKSLEEVQSDLTSLGLKLEDVRTATVSIPPSHSYGMAAAVTGNFNQEDLLARIRANPKYKLTSETYKAVTIYTNNTGKPNSDTSFAFFDAGTVIIGTSTGVHASADVKAGDKPSLAQNEKLSSAMAQNAPGAIRFAIAPPPGLAGSLKSSSVPLPDFTTVSLIFGTVGITSGIDLNATLRNDTAEHAKAMANQLNGLLAMAKGFLGASSDPKTAPIADAIKNVNITDSDIDVKVSGSLPKELLARIIH